MIIKTKYIFFIFLSFLFLNIYYGNIYIYIDWKIYSIFMDGEYRDLDVLNQPDPMYQIALAHRREHGPADLGAVITFFEARFFIFEESKYIEYWSSDKSIKYAHIRLLHT